MSLTDKMDFRTITVLRKGGRDYAFRDREDSMQSMRTLYGGNMDSDVRF